MSSPRRFQVEDTISWVFTSALCLFPLNVLLAQFPIPDDFNPGASWNVNSWILQADGNILVGGEFSSLGGDARKFIGRLHEDGTLDSDFDPGASLNPGSFVRSLAMQADGKILVGGRFPVMGGLARGFIGRLGADGTLDNAFDPGANWDVNSVVLQPDGKILVGGAFTALGGQSRSYLGRLNMDATTDNSFNPGANYIVYSLAVQTDGRILVGGGFTALGGQPRSYLGRLNSDGSLDSSFRADANNVVQSIAVLPDGRILVGGQFTTLGGHPRNYIARLHADGTVDDTFSPGANAQVHTLAVQIDKKIVVGGDFSVLAGQPRNGIARLNHDGTLDDDFNPIANDSVVSLALQRDGKILVGGGFSTLGGQRRSCIARLYNTQPATESLDYDGETITWSRWGSGPEVWRTTFDYSLNGTTWTNLGVGERIVVGWRLTGIHLPPSAILRVRGYATGGRFNASSWHIESYRGRAAFASGPASRTNAANTSASFAVATESSEPVTYQWFKNGVALANQGNVSGATSATLTLTQVYKVDEGGYSVALSNGFGSVTSAVATLTVLDPFIIQHPSGTNRSPGEAVTFSIVADGTPPLDYQWFHDGVALPGSVSSSLTLQDLSPADAGLYTAVVRNANGTATSSSALLTVNAATLDGSFNQGANGEVDCLAVQTDGRILVGGNFTTLGGQPRNRIARLDADGSLDGTFNPGANGVVFSMAVQADGRILVGGGFSTLGGQSRNNIGRLHADGTLDTTFNLAANNPVFSLALQADGKILVGGIFTTLDGQPRNRIGRLNGDGTLDSSFNPGANDYVRSVAVQADGKILLSGRFTTLGGQPCGHLGRLYADGTLEGTFNPEVNSEVLSLTLQGDGKILAGGSFTTVGGQPRNCIARLWTDGTLDSAFNPGANNGVYSLMVQANGKILVSGRFTTLGGQTRNYVGRLNADGTLDSTFNPGANNEVRSLAIQANGKILAGGIFTSLGDLPRTNIARLNNTGPATQTLSYDGTNVTWLRVGTSPEVWRTTFEHSIAGLDWTNLGAGTRISDGWQLPGVSLPPIGTLRARGYAVGGLQNASSWFVERYYGVPVLVSEPTSRTNVAGTFATFTVVAGDTESLNYQWLKNGVALGGQENIAGATGPTLTLSQVFSADDDGYSVVLSNTFGSVTSVVARLTVLDPFITQHPTGAIRNPGESVTFNVMAVGTPPLSYQWYQNGAVVPGAISSSLVSQDLSGTNAGLYTVAVSTKHGSITSAPALLTVNAATSDSIFNPGADNAAFSMVLQPDRKVLVGGFFTRLVGQPCNYLGRLNPDGTLDNTFKPEANSYVLALALQEDGKVLAGGNFSTLAGQPRNHIGRLNADGTLDDTFNLNGGANNNVNCLMLQPDGKILVGGSFSILAGQPRNRIARLNADGTLDDTFNLNGEANNSVSCLALQPNGKILLGGSFTTLGGQPRTRLARLAADGTLDTTFDPRADNIVYSVVEQADGKILIGGSFRNLSGQTRNYLGRLHVDGTLDDVFNPGADDWVISLALQADGKILVGGRFTTLGGQARSNIARLQADGMLDGTFNPGANGRVISLALQADGKVLLSGYFNTVAGQIRNYIGGLNNTGPATQNLSRDGASVTWLRSGTGPEAWRTTLEHSTNGLEWTFLGAGERIPDGWQFTGASSPSYGILRARGHAVGGYENASGGIVETILDLTIRLHLIRDSSTAVLNWSGGKAPYQVQQTTDASQQDSWQDVGTPMQTNSISLPIGSGTLFLRVRGQ